MYTYIMRVEQESRSHLILCFNLEGPQERPDPAVVRAEYGLNGNALARRNVPFARGKCERLKIFSERKGVGTSVQVRTLLSSEAILV